MDSKRDLIRAIEKNQGRRGFVAWLADELGVSIRHIQNLRRDGKIDGVVCNRAPNLYFYVWEVDDAPKLVAWIQERKRFRKGNRKRPPKRQRKKNLTGLQRFANAIRRVNSLASSDAVASELKRASEERLRGIERLLERTLGFYLSINRQIRISDPPRKARGSAELLPDNL